MHTKLMLEYGTNIAAGVTPGKGGQKFQDVPIYETMKEAVTTSKAKISIVFVPAKFFLEAAREAFEAVIKLLIAIPEHVPVRDAMQAIEIAKQNNAIMIGPNTPGVIIPGLIKIGIMPASPFMHGNIAVLSKSGTLLYEISNNLTTSGFGQIFTLGIGLRSVKSPSMLKIEKCNVRLGTFAQRPLCNADYACRTSCKQLYHPHQTDSSRIHQSFK